MSTQIFLDFFAILCYMNTKFQEEVTKVIQLIILIILVWALQCVFTLFQLKYFNREYINLRKKGFVLIGKQRSRISRGCVILLLITKDGEILDGKVMNGYTVFTRFRTLTSVKSRNIMENWNDEKIDNVIKKALYNAQSNYIKELEMLNTQNIPA